MFAQCGYIVKVLLTLGPMAHAILVNVISDTGVIYVVYCRFSFSSFLHVDCDA